MLQMSTAKTRGMRFLVIAGNSNDRHNDFRDSLDEERFSFSLILNFLYNLTSWSRFILIGSSKKRLWLLDSVPWNGISVVIRYRYKNLNVFLQNKI